MNMSHPNAEIYPLFDDDNYVIAVVTIAENEGSTTNYAYITGDVNSEAYANDEYTWTLPAIVNGKKVELTEIGDTLDVLDELDKGNWYKIKYDADGYVRGYEAIENQITDGDYDSSDCYINDVAQLEKALEVNDTVLLDQYFANGVLTFENGTLYTDTAKTEGININPDVKVVLALADKNKKPFDDVDDSYTGYSGLEKALRNLDSIEKDLNNDGIADYAFIGNLAAIVEGGDGATTIILDDRSGKADPNYNPLEDMKVTINLVDIDTNRILGTDTIIVEDSHDVTSTLGIAHTYPTAYASAYVSYVNSRWATNYTAVPTTDYASLTYDEAAEKTYTFYYRETEVPTVENTIKVEAPADTFVEINGVSKGNGGVFSGYEVGDGVSYKVIYEGDIADPEITVNDKVANNGRITIAAGENVIKVEVAVKTYDLKLSTTHNSNGGQGWSITNEDEIAGSYAAGTPITFKMQISDTYEGVTDVIKTATINGGNAITVRFENGENAISATWASETVNGYTDFEAALAKSQESEKALYTADNGGGKKMTSFTDWDGTTTLYYMSQAEKDATCATLEFTFTMPKSDVDVTDIQVNP